MMDDELLYTQEDIDEWIRTCESLQIRNNELRNECKLYLTSQNQKAIECLKEVKIKEMSCDGKKVPEKYIACFNDYIDSKIKELEGENEHRE